MWSPTTQDDINEIERLQKSFTARKDGMEKLIYHQRLKELKLYILREDEKATLSFMPGSRLKVGWGRGGLKS